jgi:hypothetical protein
MLLQGLLAFSRPSRPMPRRTFSAFVNWNLAVVDDLDVVAPGVAEVECGRAARHSTPASWSGGGAASLSSTTRPNAVRVGRLRPPWDERANDGRPCPRRPCGRAAAELEVEDCARRELERLLDVADLEGDVVQATRASGGSRTHPGRGLPGIARLQCGLSEGKAVRGVGLLLDARAVPAAASEAG